MRKFLAGLLSAITLVLTFAGLAYVATPNKTDSQLQIVSVKAVDVANTITGIRAYTDLVDTEKTYQKNDVMYIAATVEVKNLGKSANANLISIQDKAIDVVVGSSDVDLSYAKYSAPTIISYIYGGLNSLESGTVATEAMSIAAALDYDKNKNEMRFTFRGTELNQVNGVNALSVGARVNSAGEITLPALRAKDGNTVVEINGNTYSYPYTAPDALTYTVLITGVVKELNQKTEGGVYAKLLTSSAERFSSYGSYYVLADGSVSAAKPSGNEYVDYVQVRIYKLEIKGQYNVYRYEVPASGLYDTTAKILYKGDYDIGDKTLLGKVSPNQYDHGASNAQTTVDVAGAVHSVKAYKDTDKSGGQSNVPASSAVFTTSATYFAPSFYTGVIGKTPNKVYQTQDVAVQFSQGGVQVTRDVTRAQEYTGTLTYNWDVTQKTGFNILDDISIELSAQAVNAKGNEMYGSYDAAYAAWQADTSSDKPAAFDAGRYPYVEFQSSLNASSATATYSVTRLSGSTGESKIKVVLTVKGGSAEEVTAYDTWKPVVKGDSAIRNAGDTYVYGKENMELTSKKADTITSYVDGYKSVNTLDIPDDEFAVTATDSGSAAGAVSGAPIAASVLKQAGESPQPGEYEVVKTVKNGKVTGLAIVPVKDSAGNLPPWCANDPNSVAWYPNGSAASAANADATGPITVSVRYQTTDPSGTSTTTDSTTPASESMLKDVVGSNGIAMYTITSNDDDRPIVSIATEDMYFSSDDGYTIALFDNYNNTAKRIARSNGNNLTYVDGSGNVSNSSKIIEAFTYFGLDTSFDTTYKVTASSFEAKGAAASYTAAVTGSFKYGAVITQQNVDEGTEEEVVEDAPEEENQADDIEVDEIPDETVNPKTGDPSANLGLWLLSSGVVVAAGFVLLMKRVRQ